MNTDPQTELLARARESASRFFAFGPNNPHGLLIAELAGALHAKSREQSPGVLRAVPAPVAEGDLIDGMANAFLCWPLPESVCADRCATKQGAGRIGTNLLSFTEARQMFRDVVGPILADKLNRAPVAPAWVKTAPTESDWYWHWNGDPDCGPVPVSVLWSGTTGKCFVSAGQLGIERAVDCEEYGGLWQRIVEPPTQLPARIGGVALRAKRAALAQPATKEDSK